MEQSFIHQIVLAVLPRLATCDEPPEVIVQQAVAIARETEAALGLPSPHPSEGRVKIDGAGIRILRMDGRVLHLDWPFIGIIADGSPSIVGPVGEKF